MKIIVLGSAAAGANAGSGCTGYLAQSGGTQLLIDCGPGTVPELKRHVDSRELDGIVISHMHLDHILDLVTLRGAYRYAPDPFAGRIPLWLPPGGGSILDSLAAPLDLDHHSPLFFDQVFQTREYNPIDSLQIGSISVDFAPTQHAMPAWAMRVAASGSDAAIGITSDTGPVTNLAAFMHGVHVLICEATLLESHISPMERDHLTGQEAGRLAATCRADRLILTHTWDELGADTLVQAASRAYDGPVQIGWPGMELSTT
ncbi:MAG: MBL fold metallo-hydrolase [Thermomicrobiales bacterium]|nr:MAG: MBL fold metallo-hydrolase [Thermomicrobiales bacterium]